MNAEMQELSKNKSWDLVPSSHHEKATEYRWIFKVKHNTDGTVNQYKAQLVAKGYVQIHSVNYEENFAPMAKMTTITIVIALATAKVWNLTKWTSRAHFSKVN